MRKFLYIILLMQCVGNTEMFSQYQRYIVETAPFSSRINDEFSPVFYSGGIVYCSNQSDNSLFGYGDEHNNLFSLFFVTLEDSLKGRHAKIFSKEISTGFNEGPVTFFEKKNIMFYSRNNSIETKLRNINDSTNKLGIYSAEFVNGTWTNIKPFYHTNPLYSFCTPALTPNGERIYFSSDMPGGSGGMDLYFCDWQNNEWNKPVNMGSVINTAKNESFPFAAKDGKLYFASDGHNGFGGKDLFYTREINGKWIVPIHMDSAMNTTSDDFGLVADSTGGSGYFSSNRLKTDDIFSFRTEKMEFVQCEKMKVNQYCFTFYDENQLIDSESALYQWDFGDGIKGTGIEVEHCFPGPGQYSVILNITDKLTGQPIAEDATYKVDLKDAEQAYINSDSVGIVNQFISFDALQSNLKDFKISGYYWNFGDGFVPGPARLNHTFYNAGEFTVFLGLLGEKDETGLIPKNCVKKLIKIKKQPE